jgi:hypothetical protein
MEPKSRYSMCTALKLFPRTMPSLRHSSFDGKFISTATTHTDRTECRRINDIVVI